MPHVTDRLFVHHHRFHVGLRPVAPLDKRYDMAALYGRDVFNLSAMRERLRASERHDADTIPHVDEAFEPIQP